eukprot:scaffold1638_cov258-Pinguiococcus_pyrenoidosus.AAC.84
MFRTGAMSIYMQQHSAPVFQALSPLTNDSSFSALRSVTRVGKASSTDRISGAAPALAGDGDAAVDVAAADAADENAADAADEDAADDDAAAFVAKLARELAASSAVLSPSSAKSRAPLLRVVSASLKDCPPYRC